MARIKFPYGKEKMEYDFSENELKAVLTSAIEEYEPGKSPEELVIMKEQYQMLCHALNSLPEIQGRRVDANIIMGRTLRDIAREENVAKSSVGGSVKIGLASMKKYLQENW